MSRPPLERDMAEWEKALVSPETSIRDALVAMSNSRQQIAIVVDESRTLLGTVTDGDVRRSILHQVGFDQPVSKIMFPRPSSVSPDATKADKVKIMRARDIQHLPVVDENKRVIGLVTMSDLLVSDVLERPNGVVLLVGGLGSRLKPLTDARPKPLLPVGDRPVLDTIVYQLHAHGFRRMYLAVNHMANAIKDHFGDGAGHDVSISYLEEQQPLGTAGPLSLLNDVPAHPLIVMNGDILTNVNFSAMIAFHEQQAADATVATRTYEVEVPYGVIKNNGAKIEQIAEKPVFSHQVSAGIYVFSPHVLARLERNVRLDMPDFLAALIAEGHKVVGFPIHEYWVDIGRIEDLNKAAGEYSRIFNGLNPPNGAIKIE